jgi:hypothetical protein
LPIKFARFLSYLTKKLFVVGWRFIDLQYFCRISYMTLIVMQAVTGDSVLLKFEKAKCALEDSLRRVEDIVPQSIGCQV